jgi:hypothetical protein
MLTLSFAAGSLLYATVGQAGGTAFLALMAFASFPASEMRPTALLLNIVAQRIQLGFSTGAAWLIGQSFTRFYLRHCRLRSSAASSC